MEKLKFSIIEFDSETDMILFLDTFFPERKTVTEQVENTLYHLTKKGMILIDGKRISFIMTYED